MFVPLCPRSSFYLYYNFFYSLQMFVYFIYSVFTEHTTPTVYRNNRYVNTFFGFVFLFRLAWHSKLMHKKTANSTGIHFLFDCIHSIFTLIVSSFRTLTRTNHKKWILFLIRFSKSVCAQITLYEHNMAYEI